MVDSSIVYISHLSSLITIILWKKVINLHTNTFLLYEQHSGMDYYKDTIITTHNLDSTLPLHSPSSCWPFFLHLSKLVLPLTLASFVAAMDTYQYPATLHQLTDYFSTTIKLPNSTKKILTSQSEAWNKAKQFCTPSHSFLNFC